MTAYAVPWAAPATIGQPRLLLAEAPVAPGDVTLLAQDGAATAAGGSVGVGAALVASAGTASAAGGSATPRATLVASAGAATAAGGSAGLSVTLAASGGQATATGGSVSTGSPSSVSAAGGAATATGGSVGLTVRLAAASGAATATGGSAAFGPRLVASGGAATATGGAAALRAVFGASGGQATAAGGSATATSGGGVSLTPAVTAPAHLRRWAAAVSEATFTPAVINLVGDELTVGVGSDGNAAASLPGSDPTYRSTGLAGQLRTLFGQDYYGVTGDGIWNVTDSRVSLAGGAVADTASGPNHGAVKLAAAGQSVTYSLPACPDFEIWLWDGGTGTITFTVDGGAPTSLPAGSGGTAATWSRVTVTGQASTTHSLVIAGAAGATAYVAGVQPASQDPGVRVNRMGRVGTRPRTSSASTRRSTPTRQDRHASRTRTPRSGVRISSSSATASTTTPARTRPARRWLSRGPRRRSTRRTCKRSATSRSLPGCAC
jgi:hypothetical protein